MAFRTRIRDLEEGQKNIILPVAGRKEFMHYWQKEIDKLNLEMWSLVQYETACIVTKESLPKAMNELTQIRNAILQNAEIPSNVKDAIVERINVLLKQIPKIWTTYPNAEVIIG